MIENKSLSPGPGMVPGYDPSVFKPSDRGPALVSAHVPGSRSPPGSPPSRPGPGGSPSGSSPGSSPPRSGSKSDPASSTAGLPMYPPPGFPPQGVLLPNLSSPFSRPDSSFLLGSPMTDIHYSRHQSLQMVSPNDPTANACKIVDFHGEKIASFSIHGKTMLCLPQAFEIFLKNLVGGLHTVYTKCKRLEVTPMICNVEQVRVLRGLGAIQPGVNRCKLIADSDFDLLYKDCTTSRNQCYTSPAYKISKINGINNEHGFEPMQSMRPPKRVLPFPAPSPQDAMLQLNRPPLVTPDTFSREGGGHPIEGGRFPGAPPGGATFPGPGHPMAAAGHLMSLNNPAALLSRTGMLPGMPGGLGALPGLPPLHSGPGHALLESYKQSYGDMIKHLQGLQKSQDDDNEDDLEKDGEKIDRVREDRDGVRNGSVLNLSAHAHSDLQEGGGSSIRGSDSDIGEPEADIGSEEDMDMDKEDKAPNNMFQMMNQIQSLIKMTVEKAKQEEKNSPSQKSDLKEELDKEKDSQSAIKRKIEEETKTTDLYLKRFRKERKLRKQLEDQLEMETKKIQALEAALRSLSYETLVQVKENIAREAASREQHKLERDLGEREARDREGEDSEQLLSSAPPSEDTGGSTGLPSYAAVSTAASLAQLNYNISQMTSVSPTASTPPRLGPIPASFNSSLASSLPPTVSTSF